MGGLRPSGGTLSAATAGCPRWPPASCAWISHCARPERRSARPLALLHVHVHGWGRLLLLRPQVLQQAENSLVESRLLMELLLREVSLLLPEVLLLPKEVREGICPRGLLLGDVLWGRTGWLAWPANRGRQLVDTAATHKSRRSWQIMTAAAAGNTPWHSTSVLWLHAYAEGLGVVNLEVKAAGRTLQVAGCGLPGPGHLLGKRSTFRHLPIRGGR
mmetsp:Transcript_86703/g.273512  ORF Transcript_86703/g.273512 Transcript_86703/m.273512 type:complete len:216 (-) Transcript_86703:1145-1792(-)